MKKIILLLILADKVGAQTKNTVITPGFFYSKYIKNCQGCNANFIPYVSTGFKKYYFEARYNYDHANTFGAYLGKTYYMTKDSSLSLIPQMGLLIGNITGGSLQLYFQYQKKKIALTIQNQYSSGLGPNKNFYYNWSSIGYNFNKYFSAGLSTQLYFGLGNDYNDNGFFVSLKIKDMSFMIFDFNSYLASRHYIAIALQNSFTFPKSLK